MKIEVDEEVYEFLKQHAIPLEDTPNTVLRRILLQDQGSVFEGQGPNTIGSEVRRMKAAKSGLSRASSAAFMREVLRKEFNEEFRIKHGYKTMFEAQGHLVYFGNFNEPDRDRLWYRVNAPQWELLKNTEKKAFLILTNPSDRIAYLFPIEEIERRLKEVNWERPEIEINLNHADSYWLDLKWSIAKYLKQY